MIDTNDEARDIGGTAQVGGRVRCFAPAAAIPVVSPDQVECLIAIRAYTVCMDVHWFSA